MDILGRRWRLTWLVPQVGWSSGLSSEGLVGVKGTAVLESVYVCQSSSSSSLSSWCTCPFIHCSPAATQRTTAACTHLLSIQVAFFPSLDPPLPFLLRLRCRQTDPQLLISPTVYIVMRLTTCIVLLCRHCAFVNYRLLRSSLPLLI